MQLFLILICWLEISSIKLASSCGEKKHNSRNKKESLPLIILWDSSWRGVLWRCKCMCRKGVLDNGRRPRLLSLNKALYGPEGQARWEVEPAPLNAPWFWCILTTLRVCLQHSACLNRNARNKKMVEYLLWKCRLRDFYDEERRDSLSCFSHLQLMVYIFRCEKLHRKLIFFTKMCPHL